MFLIFEEFTISNQQDKVDSMDDIDGPGCEKVSRHSLYTCMCAFIGVWLLYPIILPISALHNNLQSHRNINVSSAHQNATCSFGANLLGFF